MLVYTKEPMGYTTIDGKRVYGKYFNKGRFGPTELSYAVFRKHADILTEEPLTSEWLYERFGINIPGIKFVYTNTYGDMSFEQMIELARAIGIDYIKSHKPTTQERRALRKSVIRLLDGAI